VNGVELFELSYDRDELSMPEMVLPAGQFQSFEQSLTEPVLSGLVAGLQSEDPELKLPKFETRSSKQLAEPLSAVGLEIAFQDGADYCTEATAAVVVPASMATTRQWCNFSRTRGV
jgi:serine protease inhibitor